MSREKKRRATLCGLHYSRGQSEKKSKVRKSRNGEKANTYERKSEKTEGWRAGEQKKKQKGEKVKE